MRIKAAILCGSGLAFRGDGISQFEGDTAEPVMRFGVLWIVANGVAQVDLSGFQVTLLQGGFGGAKDAMGRTVALGWNQLGFPVEMEAPAGTSYAELKNK